MPEPLTLTIRVPAVPSMGRYWLPAKDGDHIAFRMYRRHYSAKKNKRPKIRQFVGPGEKTVLVGNFCWALFVWRKFIDDSGQEGVNGAVFRNESTHLSSDMVSEAVLYAWERWPGERLYTTIDPKEIRSTNPGCCFKNATPPWKKCGEIKKRNRVLHVLECLPI